MNFGVIGYGYWGPNVVRNLANLEGSQVIAIAEINAGARARAQKAYPNVKVVASASEVINSTEIDAVAAVELARPLPEHRAEGPFHRVAHRLTDGHLEAELTTD